MFEDEEILNDNSTEEEQFNSFLDFMYSEDDDLEYESDPEMWIDDELLNPYFEDDSITD